jgi:hypothetical protein
MAATRKDPAHSANQEKKDDSVGMQTIVPESTHETNDVIFDFARPNGNLPAVVP